MDHLIDLRSDTVTLPTDEMRAAMAAAEVGDDYHREDASINALEELAATLLSKEAALYVPTGTMGNLLAHLTHCPGGAEVIAPASAHTVTTEVGGAARVAGNTIRPIPQIGGEIDLARFEAAMSPHPLLSQRVGLIWIEQPTNGYVVALEQLSALRDLANRFGVPIHMDGARIFNAATYLRVPALQIVAYADTVMFCVSKGLGAPVGSLLVGPRAFIDEARHTRAMLGGGMRQAGIVAAGGIYALNHHVQRLQEDHANLAALHAGIGSIPGFRPDRPVTQTNMFLASLTGGEAGVKELVSSLRSMGVLMVDRHPMRFVTHLGVSSGDVEAALAAFSAAVSRVA